MKIAIIGGGICGLYLAWKLKEDVVVFERKKEIGDNVVCSGLFSERILGFIPQSRQLIENKINFVLIHFPKKTIKVAFSRPFLVMDHSKLDKMVFSLAEKKGAQICLNKKIESMPEGFDKIIGCDGFDSFVRKNLKLNNLKYRLGIQGFIAEKDASDFVEVWPQKNGFIWKIPRGEKTEYGIIEDIESANILFSKFLTDNKIDIKEIKSKIIPEGITISSQNNIALCGDAAGLTKPWSGGGVIWGLTAADILINAFPDFKKYGKKTKKFFGFKIFRSKLMVKLVYFLGFKMPWILPNKAKIESDFLL